MKAALGLRTHRMPMPRPSVKSALSTKAAAAKKPARAGVSPVHSGAVNVDLDFLPSTIGYLLRRLQQAYREYFLANTPGLDMSPKDVPALFIVARNPGISPTQMGAAMGIDGAMTSLLLASLERRGLLKREKSTTDGRSRIVSLTKEGAATVTKLRRTVASVDAQFTAGWSEEEREQLLGLLARLLAERVDAAVIVNSGSQD